MLIVPLCLISSTVLYMTLSDVSASVPEAASCLEAQPVREDKMKIRPRRAAKAFFNLFFIMYYLFFK